MAECDEMKYTFANRYQRYVRKRCSLKFLTDTKTLFYYCCLISAWDDRSWYFLVGIYLVILDPKNLTLTAIYGFLSSGIVLIFGSVIGSWADRTARLKGAVIVITIRNISTLMCSICLYLVIWYHELIFETDRAPRLRLLAKIVLILFAILAHVGGLVNNNMVSKDWLPILCVKDSQLLAKMTARFRLIDLASNIIAPIIIGQIMTFAGKSVAIIIFSVQVILTLIIFCLLLNIIYKRLPRLHYRDNTNVEQKLDLEYTPLMQDDELEVPITNTNTVHKSHYYQKCTLFVEGWISYFKHTILLPGLGLALLYMTVLGLDTVTIGYALSQGMKEFEISFITAGVAITGIIGALIYPYVLKKTNVVYTGIIALSLQFIGLIPCLLSVWASGSPFNLYTDIIIPVNNSVTNTTHSITTPSLNYQSWTTSIILLMSGIISSRVGLWMFDLTISQLLIETVTESDRGKINGVQISLNMLFEMVKFAMVLLWPLPRQFGLLILLSLGAVGSSNILYCIFAAYNKFRISSLL